MMEETLNILTNIDLHPSLLETIERAATPACVWKELDKEQFWQKLPDAHILFGSRFPPRTGQAPQLRWVQLASAGADLLNGSDVIESNVLITTVSGAHSIAVSEHVMSLMLLFTRHWPQLLALQQAGHWARRDEWSELLDYELFGRTVAIIGLGNIGRRVAQVCKALGLRVLASSRTIPAGGSDYNIDQFFVAENLHAMLGQAHFVVICVPLTAHTRHLIAEAELRAMRPDAFLINISRGEVLDQEMLLKALDQGWLRGAGLDVVEGEPLPDGHPILMHPKIVVSPHIAGWTKRYHEHAVAVFCNNLKLFRKGEPLRNIYDRRRSY